MPFARHDFKIYIFTVDIGACLYWNTLRIDAERPDWQGHKRFSLSKDTMLLSFMMHWRRAVFSLLKNCRIASSLVRALPDNREASHRQLDKFALYR